jgi:hypothetical protein
MSDWETVTAVAWARVTADLDGSLAVTSPVPEDVNSRASGFSQPSGSAPIRAVAQTSLVLFMESLLREGLIVCDLGPP